MWILDHKFKQPTWPLSHSNMPPIKSSHPIVCVSQGRTPQWPLIFCGGHKNGQFNGMTVWKIWYSTFQTGVWTTSIYNKNMSLSNDSITCRTLEINQVGEKQILLFHITLSYVLDPVPWRFPSISNPLPCLKVWSTISNNPRKATLLYWSWNEVDKRWS